MAVIMWHAKNSNTTLYVCIKLELYMLMPSACPTPLLGVIVNS